MNAWYTLFWGNVSFNYYCDKMSRICTFGSASTSRMSQVHNRALLVFQKRQENYLTKRREWSHLFNLTISKSRNQGINSADISFHFIIPSTILILKETQLKKTRNKNWSTWKLHAITSDFSKIQPPKGTKVDFRNLVYTHYYRVSHFWSLPSVCPNYTDFSLLASFALHIWYFDFPPQLFAPLPWAKSKEQP